MAQKPSIPKGTRDFSPQEMVRRNYIFDTIKAVFQRYGYLPIETPAMENIETLMGKYGEEGDKLIFKILESGEYTSSLTENIITTFKNLVEKDEVITLDFFPIARSFAKQISELLRECSIDDGDATIKSYLFKKLNIDEFVDYKFSQDYWAHIKNAFVNSLTNRQLLFSRIDENQKIKSIKKYVYYIEIADLRNREDKILKDFYNLIENNRSKLREIIRIETFAKKNLTPSNLNQFITKKALKYDLTVPFARYVVQHQSEITFPFKRYQIQPVWRADRPQKGRYREFYQCDADVIGSNSLINEVELTQMIDDVFTRLKVPVLIKINNRKILSGIAEVIGEKENIITITVAIDKLDKIGVDGVNKELQENGVNAGAIQKLQPLIEFKGTTLEKVNFLKTLLASSEIGLKGIEEVEYIFKTVDSLGLSTAEIELDITLARGLNYYTGAIFEVKANAGTLTSSICGGGRYDDLTGIFGLPNMSGVGISFGADRIYDVLNELNLYPESVAASTKLLFVTFGEAEQNYCLPLLASVRKAGINSEIYPDANAKMKKQMSYADDKKIPFVVIVGGDEMQSGLLSLKNMESGEQEKISVKDIIEKLK